MTDVAKAGPAQGRPRLPSRERYERRLESAPRPDAALALLPHRRVETVAAWLNAHPSIEVVARDRAGACADGVCGGAPQTRQVSDRWHPLRNLGDAPISMPERHRRDVAEVQAATKSMIDEATAPDMAPSALRPGRAAAAPSPPTPHDGRAWRRKACHDQGWTQRRIAGGVGMDCKTVRAWLRAGRPPP